MSCTWGARVNNPSDGGDEADLGERGFCMRPLVTRFVIFASWRRREFSISDIGSSD